MEAQLAAELGRAGAVDCVEPRSLVVLFGSETGNSTEIASRIVRDATRLGLPTSMHDMAGFDPHSLSEAQDVLVVVSTFGEGDPPQPAWGFFKTMEEDGAPRLDGNRFSVCALGDSAYEFFCEAGKRLDRRFEDLGAARLLPRVDCDIDYEESSSGWSAAILELLSQDNAPRPRPVDLIAEEASVEPLHDKRHPVTAVVARNVLLVEPGSTKRTRHVELSIAGTGLRYEPGDALGIIARNDPEVVSNLLVALGLPGDALVERNGAMAALDAALEHHLEITTATPRFLAHWSETSGSSFLRGLAMPDRSRERTEFLHAHHVVDIVKKFPVAKPEPQLFVNALRPLQPRLYSIASSLSAAPEEVHITVAPVDYRLHDEQRWGVTSGQLANHAPSGGRLEVYVHESPHFRLPEDEAPIIMIGAGTGIAPYRGFLQERHARDARGRSMLFFGERNAETDFLYRKDWEVFLRNGSLTEVEVAFSRDGAGKVYVQHRLRERAADLFSWLEDGAHVYVCGDAVHMAPDVHEALLDIVSQGQRRGRDAAEDYLQRLTADHRYHRDVY